MQNYKITKTGFSSAQLGHCMICGEYVEEVYFQQKKHRWSIGWTRKEVQNLFGHYWCLMESRGISPGKMEIIKRKIKQSGL